MKVTEVSLNNQKLVINFDGSLEKVVINVDEVLDWYRPLIATTPGGVREPTDLETAYQYLQDMVETEDEFAVFVQSGEGNLPEEYFGGTPKYIFRMESPSFYDGQIEISSSLELASHHPIYVQTKHWDELSTIN
jgi:hypothetical protein